MDTDFYDGNCFPEALKNLVDYLNRKRLADVFRFITFVPFEQYGPHSHLRIELNYVKKGTCRMCLDSGVVDFREGELMLLPPHVGHRFEAGEKGCTLMQLEFLPEIFYCLSFCDAPSDSSGRLDFAGPLVELSRQRRLLKIVGDVRMVQVVRSIIDELKQQDVCHDYLVVLSYAELLVLIYRYLVENTFPVGMNDTLKKAVLYVRHHYASDVSVADIASSVGVGERYLRRLFADELHLSPLGFLQQVRLDKAVELLRNTELSVKEVAYLCGFHSSQYFSRMFKRYTGVSPRMSGDGKKQQVRSGSE